MKSFQWAIVMPVAVLAKCANDSIPTFNITQATLFVGSNDGSGDNIFFQLTGPGTNISGDTGIPCFDWCDLNNFSPGDAPPIGIGQMSISLSIARYSGGQSMTHSTKSRSLRFFRSMFPAASFSPRNSNSSLFTACVPASMTSPLSGYAGSGETFTQLQLNMPAGGSFCTTWNFDAVSGQYQFSQGKFLATTVPESTFGFLVIGLVSIAGVIRMKREFRHSQISLN
jgi:hypothetical protein